MLMNSDHFRQILKPLIVEQKQACFVFFHEQNLGHFARWNLVKRITKAEIFN